MRHLCLEFAERAREAFRRVDLIHVDDALLDAAAALDPRVPRSLDAIHLAAAMTLGSQLVAVVTYDVRMADAARLVGLPTVPPS